MESLLADFDDDLFDNSEKQRRLPQKVFQYKPKFCSPRWFDDTASTENGERIEDEITILKFRADCHYVKKQFPLAAENYAAILPLLPSTNLTMRRDCMEGMVRSMVRTGKLEDAEKMAKDLIHVCKNMAQRGSSYSILAQIYNETCRYEDEIEMLQQLVSIHPLNSDHWLQMANAYAASCAFTATSNNVKMVHPLLRHPDTNKKSHKTNEFLTGKSSCKFCKPLQDEVTLQQECETEATIDVVARVNDLAIEDLDLEKIASAAENPEFQEHHCLHVLTVAACVVRARLLLQTTGNTQQYLNHPKRKRLQVELDHKLQRLPLPKDFLNTAKEAMSNDLKGNGDEKDDIFHDLSKTENQDSDVGSKLIQCGRGQFESYWFGWI